MEVLRMLGELFAQYAAVCIIAAIVFGLVLVAYLVCIQSKDEELFNCMVKEMTNIDKLIPTEDRPIKITDIMVAMLFWPILIIGVYLLFAVAKCRAVAQRKQDLDYREFCEE